MNTKILPSSFSELSVHSGTGAFTYFTLVHIDRITKKAYIIFTNSFNANTQQGVRLLMIRLKEKYETKTDIK